MRMYYSNKREWVRHVIRRTISTEQTNSFFASSCSFAASPTEFALCSSFLLFKHIMSKRFGNFIFFLLTIGWSFGFESGCLINQFGEISKRVRLQSKQLDRNALALSLLICHTNTLKPQWKVCKFVLRFLVFLNIEALCRSTAVVVVIQKRWRIALKISVISPTQCTQQFLIILVCCCFIEQLFGKSQWEFLLISKTQMIEIQIKFLRQTRQCGKSSNINNICMLFAN